MSREPDRDSAEYWRRQFLMIAEELGATAEKLYTFEDLNNSRRETIDRLVMGYNRLEAKCDRLESVIAEIETICNADDGLTYVMRHRIRAAIEKVNRD